MEHYDDGSEMNQRIIQEFMLGDKCQTGCPNMARDSLLNNFEAFREDWVSKMVEFVIHELGIDEESARHVRRNPGNYKINYDTFKLLDFK
jgi:hypothetical protein